MRKVLYTGQMLDVKDQLKIFVKAEKIIRKNKGIDDLVLELSQPCVLGGTSYEITSKVELDKTYIGYRGFMTYDNVNERIEEIKNIMKTRNILKEVIKDPKIDLDGCISEWKYGMGEVKYVYHIHTKETATKLKEAYRRGIRGGHPKLTAIYNIKIK